MSYYLELLEKVKAHKAATNCLPMDAIMEVVDYDGVNMPDVERLLAEDPTLKDELFPDEDYPEGNTIYEIVITNVHYKMFEYFDFSV